MASRAHGGFRPHGRGSRRHGRSRQRGAQTPASGRGPVTTSSTARLRAAAGIFGPLAFITTWVVAQSIRDGYDPVHDAISRLAELSAPDRWIVSTGMVLFGLSAVVFSTALRDVLAVKLAAVGFAIAGLSSLGVALFPCTQGCPGMGEFTDTAHTLAAALHYVAFVSAGWAAAYELKGRAPRALRLVLLLAPAVGGLLLLTHGTGWGANGLFQRAGLTTNDAWMIGLAVYTLRAASNTERE